MGRNALPTDASGFVLLSDFVPHIVQEIRYYSTYNFIGERINGYEEPVALLTREAARALKAVSNEMIVQGYRLKVFDAYRPMAAVKQFILWGIEDTDVRMKPYFYPDQQKQELFAKGYIAKRSSHSRGSTVDLTLFDMKTEREVDMGGTFDYFGQAVRPADAPSGGHGQARVQAPGGGVVALHAGKRAIPRHLLHLPRQPRVHRPHDVM